MHYLDNAATTRVLPDAADAANRLMCECWGNPSSLYRAGFAAQQQVDAARQTLARAMGCNAADVFFTSGGTEANNLALQGAVHARRAWANHIVTTGYEHPSVTNTLQLLAKQEGFVLDEIAPDANGQVNAEALVDAVGPKTAVFAAMQVNNETGAVLDVAALAAAVKAKNPRCFVHVDGVQGFCKLPLPLAQTAIDGYAVSGHKLHAPKGVGALYLRGGKAANLLPLFGGGGQEQNIRPGTENTPGIAAFGIAVQLAQLRRDEEMRHIATLQQRLLSGLSAIADITLHSPQNGYAGIVMFSLPPGYLSETMIHHLDEQFSVCVSGGSACNGSGLSHTLLAMGLPKEAISAAIRVSMCGENTEDDIDALLAGLRDGLATRAHR